MIELCYVNNLNETKIMFVESLVKRNICIFYNILNGHYQSSIGTLTPFKYNNIYCNIRKKDFKK